MYQWKNLKIKTIHEKKFVLCGCFTFEYFPLLSWELVVLYMLKVKLGFVSSRSQPSNVAPIELILHIGQLLCHKGDELYHIMYWVQLTMSGTILGASLDWAYLY